MKPHRLAPATLALVLAACAQPGPPPPPPPPPVDTTAAVKAIRAAGDGLDSAVQVQPLRDAAIDGFMKRARDAETRQDYAAAASAADDALKLAPDAPDLLQYRAEIDVARAQWNDAERLALKSHSLGPKSGSLCARNWQTIVEMRLQADDNAGATAARGELAKCHIAGPNRF